jgi:predicted GIY-YIG superfamily endonuclease
MHVFVVYILICSDGSFYTGMTSNLDLRIAEHNEGVDSSCYTYSRRPVRLVWSQAFPDETQALARERQIKGWRRAKKQALIRGDWEGVAAASRKKPARSPR